MFLEILFVVAMVVVTLTNGEDDLDTAETKRSPYGKGYGDGSHSMLNFPIRYPAQQSYGHQWVSAPVGGHGSSGSAAVAGYGSSGSAPVQDYGAGFASVGGYGSAAGFASVGGYGSAAGSAPVGGYGSSGSALVGSYGSSGPVGGYGSSGSALVGGSGSTYNSSPVGGHGSTNSGHYSYTRPAPVYTGQSVNNGYLHQQQFSAVKKPVRPVQSISPLVRPLPILSPMQVYQPRPLYAQQAPAHSFSGVSHSYGTHASFQKPTPISNPIYSNTLSGAYLTAPNSSPQQPSGNSYAHGQSQFLSHQQQSSHSTGYSQGSSGLVPAYSSGNAKPGKVVSGQGGHSSSQASAIQPQSSYQAHYNSHYLPAANTPQFSPSGSSYPAASSSSGTLSTQYAETSAVSNDMAPVLAYG